MSSKLSIIGRLLIFLCMSRSISTVSIIRLKSSEGSNSLHRASKSRLCNVKSSTWKVLELSSTRTFPKLKSRKKASPQACRVMPLLNLQIVGKKEGYDADASSRVEPSSSEAPLKCKRKELTAGPSKKSKKKARGYKLGLPPFFEWECQVLKTEFSIVKLPKDYDTNLALVSTVMLPKDVTDLIEEGLKEIRDLLMMQQSLKKASAISKRDASNAVVSKAQGEVATLKEQLDKSPGITGGTQEDHQWPYLQTGVQSGVKPTEPPQAYSSLVLLGFNEEEMLEEEANEILDKNPEVVSKLGQEAAEDGIIIAEDGATAVEGGLDVKEANLSYDLY
ncbi:hypothetical protein Acr_03g0014380 [Actinidia rufa]|uniref:Uncharacterized protein n=1 Tax=Actinidia rufa TaxID=165716 RepID=A0A7J0EDU8_9ERIC|nr:hypothetical protein Acr_03g0014380 [Actinidia rufa]